MRTPRPDLTALVSLLAAGHDEVAPPAVMTELAAAQPAVGDRGVGAHVTVRRPGGIRGPARGCHRIAGWPNATLYAVSDELTVVTVTYSPGPHLHRFLATLSHATDRSVSVVMADNGSTDGSPEAAQQHYPNTRLLRTGGNVGYGAAVNRAVAELGPETDFFVVANPDVAWGPASIDLLLEAAGRWPRAGALGPLIRDPDGSVYPSARHLPSLVRGGLHAVIGPLWRTNPWTTAYRQERLEPTERPVGWLSGSCLLVRKAAFDEVNGFDERYFMYMEDVDLGDRIGKAGWQNVYVPSAEILHDKGHATGRDPSRNLAAHHASTYIYLADRHSRWWQAPLRWAMRAALAVRSALAVRGSRRRRLMEGR